MDAHLRLAERQFGLISRAQLRELRLSEHFIDHRLATGMFVAELPGVYRVSGAPRNGRQRAMAATLWSAPDGVVSHATAGRPLRLDAVPRLARVDLSVPRARRVRHRDVEVHRTLHLPRIDRVTVDEIPCTSVTRTLIDLAAVLDEESLEAAFHSARRMGLTSPAHFARRFEQLGGKGRVRSTTLRRLIERERGSDRALESMLEVKAARLLRRSLLPATERQLAVGAFRLDFAWPDRMVALECDGFAWHGNRLQWKRDRRRVAQIEALGWRIIFVTWDDVTLHPDETLHRVALALRALAA